MKSDREGEILYDIHYMWELLEIIYMNLFIKQRLTDLEKELMVAGGRDSEGFWECHVHTVIFKMDNQQAPIVRHMKRSSLLRASLDRSGS